MENRGRDREASLSADVYQSEHYYSMYQLTAFCHQIRDIWQMKPNSILEVGIGNGFTSSYLKSSCFDVTTCDINPALGADITCDIFDLREVLDGKKFDLVVCCEVLEHIPFSEFDKALDVFSDIGDSLYLTLPYYNKYFGFSGFLDIPRIRRLMNIGLFLPVPRKITEEHFWEIGHAPETKKAKIYEIIRSHFPDTKGNNYELSRYHHRFICKK